jgi:flavodoxin
MSANRTPPRILIAFYSRTGNTRAVALDLAELLHADVEEIVDFEKRSGMFGYLRSGRQAFWRRTVPIKPALHRPGEYDLVVVGTPIWNVSVSAPVRSYVREHRRAMKAAAFFCTCGGVGIDRVFEQLSEESGHEPIARLAVLEKSMGSDAAHRRIEAFANQIQLACGLKSERRSA